LYNAVKARNLQYRNNAQVYLKSDEQNVQIVRLPEQTLVEKAANCLDMAVLFASLMVSCGINPLILFLPGHAIAGWRDGAGGMEFLQTTGLENQDFNAACKSGNDLYIANKDRCDACLEGFPVQIADPEDFAILVDVLAISKAHGLTKL
jgi:hypothetical protein